MILLVLVAGGMLKAQYVVDDRNPPDPIPYPEDSEGNPIWPPYDNNIYPWGYKIKGTNWDTSPYLPFVYNTMPFRLILPLGVTYDRETNTFTASDPDKKYPLSLYFHGLGEVGNENGEQLKHGAREHRDAINRGDYDGFVMFIQSPTGFFGSYTPLAIEVIQQLSAQANVDLNRINAQGLSGGGLGVWRAVADYPKFFASGIMKSSAEVNIVRNEGLNFVHLPTWQSQGGRDNRPKPEAAFTIQDLMEQNGANHRLTYYENQGHGTWRSMYRENDFFPFLMRTHKTNIHVFGAGVRKPDDPVEICPGDPVNVRMGLTPGFSGYEWRKDGNIISGATGNEYTATNFGTYEVRFRRGSEWTPWSKPVEVKQKDLSQLPEVQTVGLSSTHLPAPDGSTTVELKVKGDGVDGKSFLEYEWKREGQSGILGTNSTFTASSAGGYQVSVKDVSGCFTNFSYSFDVTFNGGSSRPNNASDIVATPVSETEVRLNWSQNPFPDNNENYFEIYRKEAGEDNFLLISLVGQDLNVFEDSGLKDDTEYKYIVRAANATGSADPSSEISVKTLRDRIPPQPPTNLTVVSTTNNAITLEWDEASDNVGVFKYDVYKNGVKTLVTSDTRATIKYLNAREAYSFTVVARDVKNNESPQSEQVTAITVNSGLTYKYYEGAFSVLPDFNTLSPINVGKSDNVDISLRSQNDNFAFLWEGFIKIDVPGTYTFSTRSDDGSKLYIGSYDEANLIVNNDGLHGARTRSGNYTFSEAGSYPIVMTFFERGGGEVMEVFWESSDAGISNQRIPNSAFKEDFEAPGIAPVPPTQVQATALSYDEIEVTWTDNSDNESGFQVFSSEGGSGNFLPVGIVGANETTFRYENLDPDTKYFFRVVANGQFGVSGTSDEIKSGLDYKYYEASISDLDQLDGLAPVKTGVVSSFTISPRERNSSIAFIYEGRITVPANGNYTFYTESDDGSELFINGTRVVENDFDQGMTERNGTITLNAGTHDIEVRWRQGGGGYGLNVRYQGPGINKQIIPSSVLKDEDINATTLSLPAAPNAPVNLQAVGLSDTEIQLTFEDNSPNEESFTIFKSVGTSGSFLPVATLPSSSGTVTFVDRGLFANVTYFYKVSANNVGGSNETGEVSSKALNNQPVIAQLADRTVRFGTSESIAVTATDADEETLSFTGLNLPSFVQLIDNGNGTGALALTPVSADQGIYNEIQVVVEDENNGTDTTSFVLEVNDNFLPELTTSSTTITLNEGASTQVVLNAADQNDASQLNWSFNGLPSFVTETVAGDQLSATLSVNPSFTQSGIYKLSASVTDGYGASAKVEFTLTVNEVQGNPILVNFTPGQFAVGGQWNDITSVAAATVNNLKDASGASTNVSLTLLDRWQNVGKAGVLTDELYPVNVASTYFFYNGGARRIQLAGLDPAKRYNISFHASRTNVNDPSRIVNISIGGESKALEVIDNATSPVEFTAVAPNAAGEILSSLKKQAGETWVYVGSITVEEADLGTPVQPGNLTAGLNAEKTGVVLTWEDRAFNENGFTIARSLSETGPFETLFTAGADEESFTDNSVSGSTTYYYQVRADNSNGSSDYTNSVAVSVPNTPPSLSVNTTVTAFSGEQTTVAVSATDEPGDVITLSATNLPAFASFTDLGSGNGELVFSPLASDEGSFEDLTVSAIDNNGGLSEVNVSLQVEAIPAPTPDFPTNLKAFGAGGNTIGLEWDDNLNNEIGYEIWRSVASVDSYSLLASISANATSYEDVVSNGEASYFYKVRATYSDGTKSEFSNEDGATLIVTEIKTNFNVENPAASPWNNTNSSPDPGLTINGLVDEKANATDISLQLVAENLQYDPSLFGFNGDNPFGENTGNNSGVVPDNVMRSTYWMDPGRVAEVKFSNLDLTLDYNMTFFASRDGGGNRTTDYSIGNRTVSLNAANNTSETVTIPGINPDDNGEITVKVATNDRAIYGYLGAIIISASKDVLPEEAGSQVTVINAREVNLEPTVKLSESIVPKDIQVNDVKLNLFPNPFTDNLNLSVDGLKIGEMVKIKLKDITGRIVFEDAYQLDIDNNFKIGSDNFSKDAGLYFVEVSGVNLGTKVFRVIKQ